jgi:hypothetical protein
MEEILDVSVAEISRSGLTVAGYGLAAGRMGKIEPVD